MQCIKGISRTLPLFCILTLKCPPSILSDVSNNAIRTSTRVHGGRYWIKLFLVITCTSQYIILRSILPEFS